MFNFEALIKYMLEGMAVAVAAFYIPQRNVELREIALIALTSAAVFAILDQFAPTIGLSARQGAGFGIGLNQVGWGHHGGADDSEEDEDYDADLANNVDDDAELDATNTEIDNANDSGVANSASVANNDAVVNNSGATNNAAVANNSGSNNAVVVNAGINGEQSTDSQGNISCTCTVGCNELLGLHQKECAATNVSGSNATVADANVNVANDDAGAGAGAGNINGAEGFTGFEGFNSRW